MTGLLLLVIDPDRVEHEIREEQSGDELFPHIYGPLNVDAVVEARPFPPNADGTFTAPA